MRTLDDLLEARQSNQVLAFLNLIRTGESSLSKSAYTVLNGGEQFDAPPWEHPNRIGKGGTSTAAGAYQQIHKTWAALQEQYGLPDFSPIYQDCAAIALLFQHGAMDDIEAGRVDAAIQRINEKWVEWECFENPTFRANAPAIFVQYGGIAGGASSPPSSPVPSFTPTPIAQEVKHMPIFMALLPSILQALPQLAQVFGTDESARAHNTAAISVVSDALVKATASPNLQAAVESLSDPAKLAAAQAAIADIWPSITEVGGGIADARKTQTASDGLPFTKQGVFWITVGLLPLVYIIVLAAIGNWEYIGDITSETRAQVIGTVLGTILGGIVGYFYGTSAGSQRKTDVLAAK